ncbi:hypothetical protein GGR57DRAFT_484935 [Xylariaceae sp. FL1272]|nr:hypothetical protein GGR57DRAFT_484935 [Xylariaceae sp. FL1272]
MESYLQRGGLPLGFQRRLSRLYNDTKKSSDFVQEPVQAADDPEIKALHRKLRIQKDRLVSWGLEWSDPNQSAEIDESLNEAGLTDLVGSIMNTIKDILAEAEPLWLASKRSTAAEKSSEKPIGDKKAPIIVWDKGRFEDLVKDLTASIDTLCDLSRTRSSAAASTKKPRPEPSIEDIRPYGSSRIRTPQQIDPQSLISLRSIQALPLAQTEVVLERPQEICFMSKQAYADLTHRPVGHRPSPVLVEYASFDPIYSATGIMPELSRFEKLSAALQTESSRSSAAWIGLPLLLGYYEEMAHSRLALIYSFPPTFNAVTFENLTETPVDNLCTLTNLLNRPDFEPTLEAKFRLAYNLANTVFDMHSRGITHGNIHASAISFTNTIGSGLSAVHEVDIRRPLISSFDIFPDSSPAPSSSTFLLHRHPLDPRTTNQSPLAANSETQTLDLYSLAMLLVSIGLWTTLENLIPNRDSPSIPESVLDQIAIRCGTPYMRAVQTCWNAVEHELSRPGSGDEIIRQVQARVSGYLEACCILDGVSGLDDRISDDFGHSSARAATRQQIPAHPSPGPSATKSFSSRDEKKPVFLQERSSSAPLDTKLLKEFQTMDSKPEKPKEKSQKLRLYPQISPPAEIVDQWNEVIMPQINMALRHFYRKNPESVEISLESIGESPQKTTPTALVVCTSVSKVRAILTKKLGILFDGTTTGVSLKVCRGSLVRSRKGPKRSMAKGDEVETSSDKSCDDAPEEHDPSAANPGYQERPQNGASIGAWIGDKHLPPVSLGGIILVDDNPYGMTVHHMLDDPDRPLAPGDFEPQSPHSERATAPTFRSSAAGRDLSFLSEGETSSVSSGDDFACEFSDTESEYSVTDITSDEEDDDDDEYEQFNEPGDIPGIEPGCGDGYIITQPALDDVPDGFYPSSDTENEDHIDTCSVGEVYASSGIRRRNQDGLVHEIDWALFEFQDHRMPDENLFPHWTAGDSRHTAVSKDLQPVEIAPAKSLPGLDVQCLARTSGLQVGRILPAITSVKMYGRASPSHSYQVSGCIPGLRPNLTLPNHTRQGVSLGIPGDSGAWIIDRLQGRLCGHVLAWSGRKQVAYICPMEVLFSDIADTLEGADVRLPLGGVTEEQGNKGVIEVTDLGWSEANAPETRDIRQSGQFFMPGAVEPGRISERPESSVRGREMGILARDMDKVHF